MEIEPSSRAGHYSAAVGGQLYVVGGLTENIFEMGVVNVHCFNQCRETWQTRATTGDPPPGFHRGACTTTGHHLYMYGGTDGQGYGHSLHKLDVDTLEWSRLPSGPMKKGVCGLISCEKQLILFGGYGLPSGHTQPGAQFVASMSRAGYGWTNQLHSFNLKEGE